MSPVCTVTRRLQCPRFNMRFNMTCETCCLNCSRMVTLICAGKGAPMSCSSLLSGVRCPRACDSFASSCCCELELLWAGGDVSSSNASGPMLSNVTHTHTHTHTHSRVKRARGLHADAVKQEPYALGTMHCMRLWRNSYAACEKS